MRLACHEICSTGEKLKLSRGQQVVPGRDTNNHFGACEIGGHSLRVTHVSCCSIHKISLIKIRCANEQWLLSKYF